MAAAERAVLALIGGHSENTGDALHLLDQLQDTYEPHFRDPPGGRGGADEERPRPVLPAPSTPPIAPPSPSPEALSGEAGRPGGGGCDSDLTPPQVTPEKFPRLAGTLSCGPTKKKKGRPSLVEQAEAGNPVALLTLNIYDRIKRTPGTPTEVVAALRADRQFLDTLQGRRWLLGVKLVKRAAEHHRKAAQKSAAARKSASCVS